MTSRSLLLLFSSFLLVPACVDDTPDLGEDTAALAAAKVTICHVPPGNPGNAHAITVGEPAVRAHLAHGDSIGACAPVCVPAAEACGDAIDNDCDGVADEGCVCTAGAQRECYSGPAGTSGVGACGPGLETCDADGRGWGACVDETVPAAAETCGNGADDDCDGVIDDGCCVPVAEVCGDAIDDDCDGVADDGCIGDRGWEDADRDGLQGAGEVGMPGVTMLLRTAAGALVSVAVTDADGTYWFTGVPAGEYFVEAVPPPGWMATDQDAGDDTLDSDVDPDTNATDPFVFDGGAKSDLDVGVVAATQT